MNITKLNLQDAFAINLNSYKDERGVFIESFNQSRFKEITGITTDFIQDNLSISHKNVLRGMHYQLKTPQAKLISVIQGSAFDIIIDLRISSPTFKKYFAITLNTPSQQLYIPAGFAHGFLSLEDNTIFSYKVDNRYNPSDEHTIAFDCTTLNLPWPNGDFIVSEKDKQGVSILEARTYS